MSDPLLPFPWFDLVLILALVALNGVLSMSELAIVSAREARLKAMVKAGSGGAKCALHLASEPGRFISTVQTGITLIGILAVRVGDDGDVHAVQGALNLGNWISVGLTAVASFFLIRWMLPAGEMVMGREGSIAFTSMDVFLAVIVGLVVGGLVGVGPTAS